MERRARLRANLEAVEDRLRAACRAAGRPRADVRLVAITKYVSADVVRDLADLGVREFGESRPQELWRKAQALPDLTWHLVGHLQRNKVERTLPLVELIHSIDSVRLLAALEGAAAKTGRPVRVLLEVHLSGEAAKQGFTADELPAVGALLPHWPHVQIEGLMTMAALDAAPDAARQTFAQLRGWRDRLRHEWQGGERLRELSMGMTRDFEAAVLEGSTLVRIGSALFEGLDVGGPA